MRRTALAFVLVAVTALSAISGGGGARAQTLEDRLRAQLVAVTTQLRQLQSGQAALQAEKDAAEKDRDALKAKLAAAEAAARSAKRAPRPEPDAAALARAEQAAQVQAQAQVQAETQQLVQARAQLAAAQAEAERWKGDADQMRADHAQMATLVTTNQKDVAACRAKNAEAIAVAKDILAAYDRLSLGGEWVRKEPFTQLKRVQIQQLEQDYGDRIYDSRLNVRSSSEAGSTPTQSPAASPSAQP